MGGDIDRVEKDILQFGVAITAQNTDRVLDVARKNRVAAFQQFIKLAENLACQCLFGVGPRDAQRRAVDVNPNAKRLLQSADVRVVLTEQVSYEAGIVEVEFQRVFAGSLGNCLAV